jgi:RNA polymerase primary sigma factor
VNTETQESTNSDLGSYLNTLTKAPLLTASEEKRLARKVQIGGIDGMKAKNKIVESNMRLVLSVARQYLATGIPFEDLIQEGAIGLMTASERFDPAVGTRFSTYAIHWVRQAIVRAVDNKSKVIRVPSHARKSLYKVELARVALGEDGNDMPTQEEISEASGLSIRKLNNLVDTATESYSLDTPNNTLPGSNSTIGNGTISDMTVSDSLYNPETQLAENEMQQDIKNVLSVLNDREYLIMSRRFGVSEEIEDEIGSVLEKTAGELGISKDKMRQIELVAIRKLRMSARNDRLKQKVSV